MATKTKKKAGSGTRFGSRYGGTLRKKLSEIEKKQKTWQKCPYCKKLRVKRVSAGIWQCRSCSTKFTGKAYIPK